MHARNTSKLYVGIDLGTTNSALAVVDPEGSPVMVRNAEGQVTTPSVVAIDPDGTVIVGQQARRIAMAEPASVAECVKRDMGEKHYRKPVNNQQVSPQAISAIVLRKLKQDCESQLGPIAGAVVTVPAYFDEGRRQATLAAGEIAGLNVIDIINEPTAAALAYAYSGFIRDRANPDEALRLVEEGQQAHIAAIYDLGGGTFDVTILSIDGRELTVLATDGDVFLGGRDWDERIVRYMAERFVASHGSDPRDDPISLQRLVTHSEELKKHLSRKSGGRLSVMHAGHTLPIELTRQVFDDLTADLLYRTESRLDRVVTAAGLSWARVDEVLTVGGSTRMPQVLAMLERVTGRPANTSLSPDEVVAQGAAIHAAVLALQSPGKRKPVTPRAHAPSLPPRQPATTPIERVRNDDEVVPLPILDDEDAAPEPGAQHAYREDEAIGLEEGQSQPVELEPVPDSDDTGELIAPDMEANLAGVLRSITTTNVNSHSLGVIMKQPDGVKINSVVIPRNTKLPTSVTRRYGTVVENQTAVTVIVVEGESGTVEECIPIGSCKVEPLPYGLPKGSTIYVTFSYDNSGRLDVKASEATSGSTAQTQVQRSNSMTPEALDRIKAAVAKLRIQ